MRTSGLSSLGLVLTLAVLGMVAEAKGQLFGGNSGNQNTGAYQPRGNWFQTQPTPGRTGYYGESYGEGRPTVTPNVGNILNDVFGAAAAAAAANNNANNLNNRPNQNYPPQNYQNNRYVQPRNRLPQPTPPKIQPPARNVIVRKIKPAANNFQANLQGDQNFADNATAETDAQQVIAASELEGRLQVATTADVARAVKNPAADPKMQADWTDYVNDPTAEKLAEFKARWGGDLRKFGGDGAVDALDAQLKVADYKQQLLDGTLTNDGKDQAIAGIETSLAGIGNPDTQKALQAKTEQLQKLNNMGKLAQASVGQSDPLGILLLGANNAGLPPSVVGGMVGMPIIDAPPVDPVTSEPISAGTTFLFNPEQNGGTVNYSLGEHAYSMGPGQTQRFASGYTIAFDSGDGRSKRYQLADGSYKFIVGDQGWDLQSVEFQATIDNSEYSQPFHFVANEQAMSIPAGESQTLASNYPIEVSFDRGDGGEPVRKRLDGGTFLVGLDPQQTRLDLFEASQVAPPAEGPSTAAKTSAAQKRAQLVKEKLRGKKQSTEVDRLLQTLGN